MGTPTCHASEVNVGGKAGAVPLVFIVDDDISVRQSIQFLVEDSGWQAEVFGSALEFLARERPACPSCLILDVGLPDVDGLELQRRIADSCREMPIIFLTGRADVGTSVRALKAGAVEFLTKPFSPQALRDAMSDALQRSRALLEEKENWMALRDRYQSLSPREREVMELVVRGHLNKQAGGVLGISEITVKAHRGRVMRKMGARSLPELVINAVRLGLDCAQLTAGRAC
jgi:FixJ family two-component response regulator